MGSRAFEKHLQSFGARVGSPPRKFGLFGNFVEDGSEVSAAEVISLQRADSAVNSSEDRSSRLSLPPHQYSPACLIDTQKFQDHLTSNCKTHCEALEVLQQLEAYKALSKADPAAFRRLWQVPSRHRHVQEASSLALALEMLCSLGLACLLPAIILLPLSQVHIAVILAANILQLWAWTHGTSICGRLLGLWWEEPMFQHSASLSRISMACLADFIYTVSTLGLGGLVCLCSRILTGRTIGERWAGVYMVHEGWQPYKGS